MADLRPLKLKQERASLFRSPADRDPFVLVLVEHKIVHLNQLYEYFVPQELSDRAVLGALVEVEFGHSLTHGIIVKRSATQSDGGELKSIQKVLSTLPYVMDQQLQLVQEAANRYGCNPWDLIKKSIPPFSKTGESSYLRQQISQSIKSAPLTPLPPSLKKVLQSSKKVTCAIELPTSSPYWEMVALISVERLIHGSVLLLVPNEREQSLLEEVLKSLGSTPIAIKTGSGKSERYFNYLQSRSAAPVIIVATRSSSLLALGSKATIIVLDDVDESHYERQAPTWNTRELIRLREQNNSVLYVSSTLSLEIAERIAEKSLPLYRFPTPQLVRFHSAAQSGDDEYFSLIKSGLRKGSVLISLGSSGYVSAFSCQRCRNLALCECGGKLYLPSRGVAPRCATCTKEYLEWSCSWCQGTQARAISRGVHRKAEEFGKAFPGESVLASSAEHPAPILPKGRHLVLSTPGVEPRGSYAAIIFLDLENRLLRTTLRAKEEVRFHVLRNLTMLSEQGSAYFSLQQSDPFLQSILRAQPLLAAEREIEERDAVELPPRFTAILISSEDLEPVPNVLARVAGVRIVGPFLRNNRKSLLIKARSEQREDIVRLLEQVNRVQSMRKAPLLTYQIDPYSLN